MGGFVEEKDLSSLAKQLEHADRTKDIKNNWPSALDRPGDNTKQDVETGKNLVFIIQGKISLEAVEDKILILNDRFKSGYECKSCDGTGETQECICVKQGHPGLNELGFKCKLCLGMSVQIGSPCKVCRGSGQSIIIPESSKQMPTSGVIVSLGPKCATRKMGERVLYGAHTGYNLPFKGNVRVRIMREHEILCLMEKVDPSATLEDFQLLQEPIDNASGIR